MKSLRFITSLSILLVAAVSLSTLVFAQNSKRSGSGHNRPSPSALPSLIQDDPVVQNGVQMIWQGRQIFRFDTFGDEVFWGDTLMLHQAIEGAQFGGVGSGISPNAALALGLKVDADALYAKVVEELKKGKLDLNDTAVNLALLKQDADMGVKGFYNPECSLRSVGLTCAICHSTVNDSLAPGVGHRLDGWPNRDLNVGAIISLAPHLEALAGVLGVSVAQVKQVLAS